MKIIWRHRVRSMLTALGSAMAMFLFCFVGSIQSGLDDLIGQQEADRSLIVFQKNKFCPATSQLPEVYADAILEIDGVREVVPIQVFTNNCRASLDVVVFYGMPPEKVHEVRDFTLASGSWDTFSSQQDAALIGSAVARRREISTGDTFSIGEYSVRVAGIYDSENQAEENYIYTHLDYLQRGDDASSDGLVTQFEIVLRESADAAMVQEQVDTLFAVGQVETDTRMKGAFQQKSLGDLMQMIRMSGYLGYGCVGLLLVLLMTTTLMSVQDRIKEHAVMKTLGYSRSNVFSIVLLETAIIGIIGGAIGIAAAVMAIISSGLAIGAEAVTIAFTPSLDLVLTGGVLLALGSMVAGIIPAWVASRTSIIGALHAG
ncbi:MAG: ABC transporter permease [Pirellulales bacterium]|nr:ABC transporter permease [Pirellulales bacterium]